MILAVTPAVIRAEAPVAAPAAAEAEVVVEAVAAAKAVTAQKNSRSSST
jgi:hypothetical protein